MHEKLRAEASQKILHSRTLMQMKDRVRKLTFAKRYEEAELVQMQTMQLEEEEREAANNCDLEEKIER